jgi:hypothetical protein
MNLESSNIFDLFSGGLNNLSILIIRRIFKLIAILWIELNRRLLMKRASRILRRVLFQIWSNLTVMALIHLVLVAIRFFSIIETVLCFQIYQSRINLVIIWSLIFWKISRRKLIFNNRRRMRVRIKMIFIKLKINWVIYLKRASFRKIILIWRNKLRVSIVI